MSMNRKVNMNKLVVPSPMPSVLSRRLNFDPAPQAKARSCRKAPAPRSARSAAKKQQDQQQLISSPPCRKMRALRLFDESTSPKTIKKNSCLLTPTRGLTVNINPYSPTCATISKPMERNPCRTPERPLQNPCTIATPKQARNKAGGDRKNCLSVDFQRTKNSVENGISSRYIQEFLEVERLGEGGFGTVFKCVNRLDGVFYAVKRSLNPSVRLNEVQAHAAIGNHPNVVTYFSAWTENNLIYIQNEYCNSGSLADQLLSGHLSSDELYHLVQQVAEGLRYIHSLGLVHLDIKPANIFAHKVAATPNNRLDHPEAIDEVIVIDDDGFEDIDETAEGEQQQYTITYKLGDLGHVTSVWNPQVEDGDCHYLSREILHGDHSQLRKADIFAFGMTLLEAAGLKLPKNGEEWQRIRDGVIPPLPEQLPDLLMDLVRSMIDNNPAKRPSAAEILKTFLPTTYKSEKELRKQLQGTREEVNFLLQKLEKCATSRQINKIKIIRSFSTTTF